MVSSTIWYYDHYKQSSCKNSLVHFLKKKSFPFHRKKIVFSTFSDSTYKQLIILFHQSPISTSHGLERSLAYFFRKETFWQIRYDFQVGLYFVFESFNITLNITTIWQYILLLSTKKRKKS